MNFWSDLTTTLAVRGKHTLWIHRRRIFKIIEAAMKKFDHDFNLNIVGYYTPVNKVFDQIRLWYIFKKIEEKYKTHTQAAVWW